MNKHMQKYPKRPHRFDDAIRAKAAELWAERNRNIADEEDLEEIRKYLLWADIRYDGFELGKMIEDFTSIEVDLELCNSLDEFGSIARYLAIDAEKEWEKINKIEPPYPIGTKVKFKYGEKEGTGVIRRVYHNLPATYCISSEMPKMVGTPLVRFEDVEAIEEES